VCCLVFVPGTVGALDLGFFVFSCRTIAPTMEQPGSQRRQPEGVILFDSSNILCVPVAAGDTRVRSSEWTANRDGRGAIIGAENAKTSAFLVFDHRFLDPAKNGYTLTPNQTRWIRRFVHPRMRGQGQ